MNPVKPCLLFSSWTLLLMISGSAQEPTLNGVVDARLVNGDRRCSGHLEMKHQGQWRTLKLGFYIRSYRVGFAQTACQQMGCGAAVSVTHQANTTVSRPAWEVHFPCYGGRTIQECKEEASHKEVNDIESTVSSTIVECSEFLTLNYWSSSCSGVVMVKSPHNFIHVCESEVSSNDQETMGRVICAELGCGSFNHARYFSVETGVESSIIQCHGNKTRIEECSILAHSDCKKVLHITCASPYSVRLVGGTRCRGVLEGKNEQEWKPLTNSWSMFKEHQLMNLCYVLGCGTLISSNHLYLGQNMEIWETAHECEKATFCKMWRETIGQYVVNLACTEAVRLVSGRDKCSGFVAVKHEGDWRNLCQDSFTPRHAFVACRDLECGFPGELQRPKGKYVQNTLSLNCSGHEEHLAECPVASLPAEGANNECNAAYITCRRDPIAPEMTMFSRLADVQAKQNTLAVYSGHSVLITCSIDSLSRVRSFLLTSVDFMRNQSAVDNAAHFVFEAAELNQKGYYYCSYDYELRPHSFSDNINFYLDVKEASYVRLVGEESRCLGSLELEREGEWRAVSQQQWGLKEAAVVCRQLHCGSVISTDTQSRELQPVWRFYSDCDGSERALLSCGGVREWMSSSTVHVLCSDIVAPPNITILYDRRHPENTEHVVVHKGHSFFIKCSVEPQFPGGHFSLSFSGSEKLNLSEAAIRYSAVFIFSKVSKDHSGNYSCLYHNTVSQHHFTFESNTVTITVEESRDIILDDGQQRDDGSKACSGTLLMRDGTSQMKMVTAETSGWDMRQASVVCRQLSCGSAVSTSKIELQTFTSMWRFFSDCDGSETALLDCGHIDEWFSTTAIQVVCAGNS